MVEGNDDKPTIIVNAMINGQISAEQAQAAMSIPKNDDRRLD
jgi:hypothetical protein